MLIRPLLQLQNQISALRTVIENVLMHASTNILKLAAVVI